MLHSIKLIFTRPDHLQLNKYETDPDFPQIFQSNTSVCLIISVFCKSCEPICEPEIVLKTFAADFQANPTDISCKIFRTISGSLSCSVFSSQILQNTGIIKQTDVLLWKIWRRYGSVSYLFSCTLMIQHTRNIFTIIFLTSMTHNLTICSETYINCKYYVLKTIFVQFT